MEKKILGKGLMTLQAGNSECKGVLTLLCFSQHFEKFRIQIVKGEIFKFLNISLLKGEEDLIADVEATKENNDLPVQKPR